MKKQKTTLIFVFFIAIDLSAHIGSSKTTSSSHSSPTQQQRPPQQNNNVSNYPYGNAPQGQSNLKKDAEIGSGLTGIFGLAGYAGKQYLDNKNDTVKKNEIQKIKSEYEKKIANLNSNHENEIQNLKKQHTKEKSELVDKIQQHENTIENIKKPSNDQNISNKELQRKKSKNYKEEYLNLENEISDRHKTLVEENDPLTAIYDE
jgi:hypothetical protein